MNYKQFFYKCLMNNYTLIQNSNDKYDVMIYIKDKKDIEVEKLYLKLNEKDKEIERLYLKLNEKDCELNKIKSDLNEMLKIKYENQELKEIINQIKNNV